MNLCYSGWLSTVAVQLASAYGMRVLGTVGTSNGEKALEQAGASLVFNHRQEGYVQNILVGLLSTLISLCLFYG